jgi:SAM-dependent methyltransferase
VAEAGGLGIEGVFEGELMQTLQSLGDGSQDIVIAFDVIEHFTKDELLPFVNEVYRVLRKGSKWIIHTDNGESPFGGRNIYGDFTHETAFTRTSIARLLMSSGFSEVISLEDTPIPHGLKSAVRWLLWKAIRGRLRLYLAVETGAGEKACIFSQNFLAVAVK